MKYAIIGLGRSGRAAKSLLVRIGVSPEDIKTFDSKSSEADFQDPEKLMELFSPTVLVVSPGVPLSLRWIKEAQKAGVRISSEISLACQFLTTEKLIGITGSVGKSTTVALLGEGARSFDPHAFVGGNFGFPLCEYMEAVLSGARPKADWIILELSSFQLENSNHLKLDWAGVTSLTSNHLERYSDQDHYYQTKSNILNHTKGPVFYSENGGDIKTWVAKHPARQWVSTQPGSKDLVMFELENSSLLGTHNQDNLALAATIACAAGWPQTAIVAMKQFPGLSHRLERLPSRNGVEFINDSKATALSSVLTAIESVSKKIAPGHQVFLLLGGRDKNLPWHELAPLSESENFQFLFFGECAGLAQEKSQLPGQRFRSLKDALDYSIKSSRPDDYVLLSPGGTSLDEFNNFEERGDFFRNYVSKI